MGGWQRISPGNAESLVPFVQDEDPFPWLLAHSITQTLDGKVEHTHFLEGRVDPGPRDDPIWRHEGSQQGHLQHRKRVKTAQPRSHLRLILMSFFPADSFELSSFSVYGCFPRSGDIKQFWSFL